MIKFNCTSCNEKIQVPDNAVGKSARCPKCGNIIEVPSQSKTQPTIKESRIIEFCCEHCGSVYSQPENMAGRYMCCAECKKNIVIPPYDKQCSEIPSKKTTLRFTDNAPSQSPALPMKVCPNCGRQVSNTVKYCGSCGKKLAGNYNQHDRIEVSKREFCETSNKSFSGFTGKILLAILIFCIILFLGKAGAIVRIVRNVINDTPSQKTSIIAADTEKANQKITDVAVRNENQTKEQPATVDAKGKLRVTATYYYNEYKGNVPEEAVILAFPDKEELKQMEVPVPNCGILKIDQSTYEKFMKDLGGGYAVTGGDGKAEMRLAPGKYKVWVLMEKMPYIQGQSERLLKCRFSEEFAKNHSVLGRVRVENAEVYPNDTTELSVNLKY